MADPIVAASDMALRANASDRQSWEEIFERGVYERNDFPLPQPGELWLDAGAYIGCFTVWLAQHGARVIAVEPDPESFAVLRENVRRFHIDAELRQRAIVPDSWGNDRLVFHRHPKGRPWRNTLLPHWKRLELERIPVEVLPWETLLRHDPVGAKLDIEGIEMPLLEEASLGSLRRLVMEWHFDKDNRVDRYEAAIERLRGQFAHVHAPKVKGPTFDHFPPSRIVWAWS